MSSAVLNPQTVRLDGTVNAPSRVILCHACGHEFETSALEIGAQVWTCYECGTSRQWGFYEPQQLEPKPVLYCVHCGAKTRHTFLGVS
jgi:DNA-directed RNA polymerase subunit RPC12/RpoP